MNAQVSTYRIPAEDAVLVYYFSGKTKRSQVAAVASMGRDAAEESVKTYTCDGTLYAEIVTA